MFELGKPRTKIKTGKIKQLFKLNVFKVVVLHDQFGDKLDTLIFNE